MQRRDALKTIGLTTVAAATLDGEVLAKSKPQLAQRFPYQVPLGWYGVFRCNKPFVLQRGTDGCCGGTAFQFPPTGFMLSVYHRTIVGKPLYKEFIKDESIIEMQQCRLSDKFVFSDQHCVRQYDLLPPPYKASTNSVS